MRTPSTRSTPTSPRGPAPQGSAEHWDGADGDLFDEYRVDEQIAKALERKVFLPSGGSLIIDRTEAMTVIDVNTGKFTGTGGNLEATVPPTTWRPPRSSSGSSGCATSAASS